MAHHSLRSHRKLANLVHALGISRATAIGHLELLWGSAYENPKVGPDGCLGSWKESDIAGAAEWPGDPALFALTLVRAGFLDGEPGAYVVHDYADWVPRFVEDRWMKRQQRAQERAMSGGRPVDRPRKPRTVHLNSATPSTHIQDKQTLLPPPPADGEKKPRGRPPKDKTPHDERWTALYEALKAEYFNGNPLSDLDKKQLAICAGMLRQKQVQPAKIHDARQRLLDAWGAKGDTIFSLTKHWDKYAESEFDRLWNRGTGGAT